MKRWVELRVCNILAYMKQTKQIFPAAEVEISFPLVSSVHMK